MVLLTLNHDTVICVAGADFYRSVAATCIVKEQISDIEGSMVYVCTTFDNTFCWKGIHCI